MSSSSLTCSCALLPLFHPSGIFLSSPNNEATLMDGKKYPSYSYSFIHIIIPITSIRSYHVLFPRIEFMGNVHSLLLRHPSIQACIWGYLPFTLGLKWGASLQNSLWASLLQFPINREHCSHSPQYFDMPPNP